MQVTEEAEQSTLDICATESTVEVLTKVCSLLLSLQCYAAGRM